MPNNKPSGNDGLTKESDKTFWEKIKISSCNSITKSYQNGKLSTLQRKALIKLIEKRTKN